jgi:proteic killer suppression protein
MQIESIRHKALRRFAETGQPRGLPADSIDRLRRMLAYIDAIETAEELRVPPNFGAHQLTGDRKGEWSLFVTKNWRMTFRINDAGAIEDMDLEDYH